MWLSMVRLVTYIFAEDEVEQGIARRTWLGGRRGRGELELAAGHFRGLPAGGGVNLEVDGTTDGENRRHPRLGLGAAKDGADASEELAMKGLGDVVVGPVSRPRTRSASSPQAEHEDRRLVARGAIGGRFRIRGPGA